MKNKNIISSFKYAFMGMFGSFKSERNMKIHFIIMLLVIILGFIYKINSFEWIMCIVCFGIVISSEMVNTAMEINTNLAMPNINPKAKLAKDISAGAVLISALMSIAVGLIIFIPKIF